jgi:hypothetical protein
LTITGIVNFEKDPHKNPFNKEFVRRTLLDEILKTLSESEEIPGQFEINFQGTDKGDWHEYQIRHVKPSGEVDRYVAWVGDIHAMDGMISLDLFKADQEYHRNGIVIEGAYDTEFVIDDFLCEMTI